jgi:hypothetical protein
VEVLDARVSLRPAATALGKIVRLRRGDRVWKSVPKEHNGPGERVGSEDHDDVASLQPWPTVAEPIRDLES